MRISDWSSDMCSSDLPARHLLCRRALPLCAVAGRGLLALRRLLLLFPEDVVPDVQRVPGPAAFLDLFHRRERPVLPPALPGPAGLAAPLSRLCCSLCPLAPGLVSGEHTAQLQSLMHIT